MTTGYRKLEQSMQIGLIKLLVGSGYLFAVASCIAQETADPVTEAERKAVQFLAVEVPEWPRKHQCFSCHNNGDAARALLRARRSSYRFDEQTLAQTLSWLSAPDNWKNNKGDPEFSDPCLAAIQFSHALLSANREGAIKNPAALAAAARLVAEQQQQDGSWQTDRPRQVGSPATYGNCLATAVGRTVLLEADSKKYAKQIRSAEQWLSNQSPRNVPLAAALIFAATEQPWTGSEQIVRDSRDLLHRAQNEEGGWGPYLRSRAEVYDTAIALLALVRSGTGKDAEEVRRGRRFLADAQLDDGSWAPTTRPAEGDSYAQQLSTTGWATMALLETR